MRYLGYSKKNSSLEVGIAGGIISSVLSALLLQARIEVDALNANDIQTGKLAKLLHWAKQTNMDGDSSNFGYSLKVLRVVMISGILLSFILIYQLSAGSDNLRWNQMVFLCVLFGVMPFVFILKHEGMENRMRNVVFRLRSAPLISVIA